MTEQQNEFQIQDAENLNIFQIYLFEEEEARKAEQDSNYIPQKIIIPDEEIIPNDVELKLISMWKKLTKEQKSAILDILSPSQYLNRTSIKKIPILRKLIWQDENIQRINSQKTTKDIQITEEEEILIRCYRNISDEKVSKAILVILGLTQ